MTSKDNTCLLIQENIAWGRTLSKSDRAHVFSCSKCNALAMEFEELDSALRGEEVIVPLHFSDLVMKKVMDYEKSKNNSNLIFREFFMQLFHNPMFRWSIGGTSFLLAFSAH